MFNKCMKFVSVILLISFIQCKKFDEKDRPDWAKKDLSDFSDADLERLLDQWEEDEDPLPEDELPEHLRPKPKINFDPNNIGDPESLLKMSKKGQTLMMFVNVKDSFSKEEANTLTQRWQTGLWNNHMQAERYMVDDKRAIFLLKDGSMAWEAKDFLIEQEELQQLTLENRPYYGKFTDEYKKEQLEKKSDEKKKDSKAKNKKKKVEL